MPNWWLLALGGVLDAIISVVYLIMYDADGPVNFSPVVVLSRLALAAGVCTIAAGIWKSRNGKSWLIVLNGLALSAYGLIPLFWKGPLSFLLFARLLVVMAISIGIFELVTARALWHRHRIAAGGFLGLAGAASFGFAVVFLALVLGWLQLERRAFHPSGFLWLGLYFGFTAICMLGLGNPRRSSSS